VHFGSKTAIDPLHVSACLFGLDFEQRMLWLLKRSLKLGDRLSGGG
jgi:hypothetical protein